MKNLILTSALATVFAGAAVAAPVQWSASVGGNDHWYEFVQAPQAVTWTEANAAAGSMTHLGHAGHLGTITSAAEQAFVTSIAGAVYRAWLGGTDAKSEGNWEWVTGEAWSYTNWAGGEPNNLGNEDYLEGWFFQNGEWNDLPDQQVTSKFLVEYSDFVAPVPLPAGLPLILGALAALGAVARRRKSA